MSIYGYNFNSSPTATALASKHWVSTSGSSSTSVKLSWNDRSWDADNGTTIAPLLPAAVSDIRVKWCIRPSTLASGQRYLSVYAPDLTTQVYLSLDKAGNIVAYNGKGTELATFAAALTTQADYNIEARVTIDSDTSGTLQVWLNGSLLTSTDGNTSTTCNTKGSSSYATMQAAGVTINYAAYWHDLIIDDDPTDTIIGNCYAKTRKIASVSSNTGFTAEGDETDIPTILNQTSPDGTDYIEASADGDTITLALEAGDEDDTDIRALCITAVVQKNGDGDCNGTLSAVVDGATTTGDETALSNGYTGLSINITGGLTSAYADAATITLTRSE